MPPVPSPQTRVSRSSAVPAYFSERRIVYETKKKSDLAVLLGYAGNRRGLTFLGLGLSALAMILGMLPYLCIWLVIRDRIAVEEGALQRLRTRM